MSARESGGATGRRRRIVSPGRGHCVAFLDIPLHDRRQVARYGSGPAAYRQPGPARAAAREQRNLCHAGHDPVETRAANRLARRANAAKNQTFADAAAAYIRAQEPSWSVKHAHEWRATLDNHVNPVFGKLAVAAVDTGLIRRALDSLWARYPETARRILDRIRRVLDAAAAGGYRDPAIPNPARWVGHMELLMPARAKA